MPGFAGFDRDIYPGDDVMAWLLANTNLVWCGYYFPAPSHDDTSWMGTQAALAAAGWGIAPVFVGQQLKPPGSTNPSAATGATDGANAAAMMASEGFAANSYVYLDLENGPPMPPAQVDYLASWCAAVQAGGYLPGVYCSHLLALDVATLQPAVRLWAWKVSTSVSHPVPNPYPDPNPSGCGYIGAYAWQLGQECIISVAAGGWTTLTVDLDSAITRDPGAPDPAAAPIAAAVTATTAAVAAGGN